MTLPYLLAGITMLALNAYVLLGGADFGAGVWDLLAHGPRAARQRAAIEQGIGPIWEANHVWVILVVVLLFTCFPPVYAHLSIALHIPISLLLVGIVLRGSAFTFRAYDSTQSPVQKHWGRIFSVSSTITPVLLGVCVGALVSGALALPEGGDFVATYVRPWFTAFAFAIGGLTLSVFAFLAAVYLTVEVKERELQEDFRRMALAAAVAVGAFAGLALLVGRAFDLAVTDALLSRPWALPFQLFTGVVALGTISALFTRRFRLARVGAAVQVSALMWGWAGAQFPALIPGVHSIESAAAPVVTLRLVAIILAAGGVVLVPSLWYLFRVFKSASTSAFERVDTAEGRSGSVD
ncbi:MAG: cytochrome d ubiquinol oxidase subunit II [Gemmatimonadaceae bacterium]|nr:cytochrome d ubiquinol oxidase subunit II [Gemmatimonadaceae bacterium]MCW5827154.1 cytochrome d ubiquinol oxidase subunit II [Gemmatimonadaceae bacterium]